MPSDSNRDRALPAALVLAALDTIECSAAFRRSARHRHLLRHLVEGMLAGRASQLKETVLATEIFGRKPGDFDPRHDSTVRVEIGRLRRKLMRYHAAEGRDATVVLHLDAGSYVPRFEFNAQARTMATPPALPTLAVLPFLNLTGRSEHDFACDVLTEELIDALVQVPGLKVIARTSVFAFKGRNQDVRDIGRTLSVSALVEGSVQWIDGRWRVVAQLIDASDGTHHWSQAFDESSGSLSNLVRPLALSVATGLRVVGESAAPLRRAARRISVNSEARDCWQRGRYLLGRCQADGYRRALQLFGSAVAADPQFALAWLGSAMANIRLAGTSPYPDDALVAAGRDALARVLAIDPQMGAAHALDAFIAYAFDRDFARAESASRLAMRYAPADVYVHHNHAWMLTMAGRFGEAAVAFTHAAELDPLDPNLRVHHGLLWFYRRAFAVAITHFDQVLEMDPANLVARVLRATALLNSGDAPGARAQFAVIAQDTPDDSIGPLGVVQAEAMAGDVAAGRTALRALVERMGEQRVGPYRMAIAHARLGDVDSAFAALDDAHERADMNLVCLTVDPSFDGLRDHPRWLPTLARYRLPQLDPRIAQ